MRLLRGLPPEIIKKLLKTKQTRGAQPYDRVPYQNRVNRNGVALVPYEFRNRLHPDGFVNGYRLLVRPREYFSAAGVRRAEFDAAVEIGKNAFLFYDNRRDWRELPPLADWKHCQDRSGSGHYIARVPATTATNLEEAKAIVRGEPQGIRFFEYASDTDITDGALQLAFLAWHTVGIDATRTDGGTDVPKPLLDYLAAHNLGDTQKFVAAGAVALVGAGHVAVCPLCVEPLYASGLMTRLEQAEGREVVDLTVTEINLFHLRDLRPGEYNHRPYQLAWGHHHCNTVARDMGVAKTLQWMRGVIERHNVLTTTAPAEVVATTVPLPEPEPEG